MIKERNSSQGLIEVVMLKNSEPHDHLLRFVDKHIDFSFIRETTNEIYCLGNGRPTIDPIILSNSLFKTV